MTSIIQPVSGCCVGWDTVRVMLYNNSPFPIAGNFQVCYTVNAGAPLCETILTSIPPAGTYLFSFNQQWNFACDGVYNLNCVLNFPGDVNLANNTLSSVIVSDTFVVGGTVSGPDTVCAVANTGVMILSGNNHGDSLLWQYSTTGFGSDTIYTNNDSTVYQFSNIGVPTSFRVFVDGGYCPDGYSDVHTIYVDAASVAGTVTANTLNVCSGMNNGVLDLVGSFGDTIYWEYSTSGGPPFTAIPNSDTAAYIFNNLTQSTLFQAVVQNGVCPPVTSNFVTINVASPTVPGTVSGGINECKDDNGSVNLLGYSGNINYWIYSIDNGSTWANSSTTTPILNYNLIQATTIYCAVVESPGCPADTSVCDTVFVMPDPLADAGLDDTIFIFGNTLLNGTGGLFYTWSPSDSLSDPNIANPVANPAATTTYILTVTDIYGCTGTDDVTIFVIDTTTSPVPNYITVANYVSINGDGKNDVWNVINIEYYPNNEVLVFNNQGQVVYQKSGYDNTWAGTYNGDKLPDGSYFYVVKVNDLNQELKGVLTITSK